MSSFYLLLAGYGGNTSQTYAYRRSEMRKEKEGRKEGRQTGEGTRSRTEYHSFHTTLFPGSMKKMPKCESTQKSFSHMCASVILGSSFHLIRLSWLIKIQQFAHCFFRCGEASWKMQAEGFCVWDNKWGDFLNPSLSSSIRDK